MKERAKTDLGSELFEPADEAIPIGPAGADYSRPITPLNYYNYFTEVEDEFVRRRGAHLLISPLDWSLVETWKEMGIPLHVVIRGINQAFDLYDARPQKYRKVNSLFYCDQAVAEAFAEYRLAHVGSPSSDSSEPIDARRHETGSVTREAVLDFINRCANELKNAGGSPAIVPAVKRASERLDEIARDVESTDEIDPEAIERDLDSLDRMLLEAIRVELEDAEMEQIRSAAKAQLSRHKKKMEKSVYESTIDNFIARRLRETCRLPRLSLFFM